MSLRSALAAVGMLLATTFQAFGQLSIPLGPVALDLDKATVQFKEIFEQTCYRQRHSLQALVTEHPMPEFEKIPRQYPVYDEARGTTLLAEWGIFTRSGPYLVGLYDNNLHPDVTSCAINTLAIRKNALKDSISKIDGLYFFEEKEENETKIIGFMHKQEDELRVLCMTPIKEELLICDCYLWSWPKKGS